MGTRLSHTFHIQSFRVDVVAHRTADRSVCTHVFDDQFAVNSARLEVTFLREHCILFKQALRLASNF